MSTQQPPPVVQRHAVVGNFTGAAETTTNLARQILTTDGATNLQLLQIDTAGVYKFAECHLGKLILGAEALKVADVQKEYILAALEGGDIFILEFHPAAVTFEQVDQESYRMTANQWMHWGKTMAVDHRGRLVIIGNVEDCKIVYILVDENGARLTVSLPMVDALENTVIYCVVSVELPKGNPVFACLEAYQYVCEGIPREDIISMGEKMLVYFEFDLESNEVFRRWDVRVERTANLVLPVPGDPGPAGVLVCSKNSITWYHERHSSQRIPIPKHPSLQPNDDIYIISYTVVRMERSFLIFVHSIYGDMYKIQFKLNGTDVTAISIQYFDSVPLAEQILVLQHQYVVALSSFEEPKCYTVSSLIDEEPEQPIFWSTDQTSSSTTSTDGYYFLLRPPRYLTPMDPTTLYQQDIRSFLAVANNNMSQGQTQYRFLDPTAVPTAYGMQYAQLGYPVQQALSPYQFQQQQQQQQRLLMQVASAPPYGVSPVLYPLQSAHLSQIHQLYTPPSNSARKSSLSYRQSLANTVPVNGQIPVSQRSASLRRANTHVSPAAALRPLSNNIAVLPLNQQRMSMSTANSLNSYQLQQQRLYYQQQPPLLPPPPQQPVIQFAQPMQITRRYSSLRRPVRSQSTRIVGDHQEQQSQQPFPLNLQQPYAALGHPNVLDSTTTTATGPLVRISSLQVTQRGSSLRKPSTLQMNQNRVEQSRASSSLDWMRQISGSLSNLSVASLPSIEDEDEVEAENMRIQWERQREQEQVRALEREREWEREQKRIRSLETRKHIACELWDTEKNYADNLRILDTHFRRPFQAVIKTSEQIVPMIFIRIVFSYVSELMEFSVKFASELEEIIDNWSDEAMLGKHFLDKSTDLTLFLKYVDNFSTAYSMIRRAEESNELFRRFNEKCRVSKETNRQQLKDLLILPIQRVTRYSLLLKDLKKHTPEEHPDYVDLDKALHQMNEIAAQVNLVKQQEEEMTRMFTVYKLVDQCPPNIIKYTRRVILEVDVSEGKSGKLVRIFLLSDLLMLARISRPKLVGQRPPKFKFIRLIDLADLTDLEDLHAIDRKQTERVMKLVVRPQSLSAVSSTLVARPGTVVPSDNRSTQSTHDSSSGSSIGASQGALIALSQLGFPNAPSSGSKTVNEDLPLLYSFQFTDAKVKQNFMLALRNKMKATVEQREKESNPALSRAGSLPRSLPNSPLPVLPSRPLSPTMEVSDEGEEEADIPSDLKGESNDNDLTRSGSLGATGSSYSLQTENSRTKSQEHVSILEFLADNETYLGPHSTHSTQSLPELHAERGESDDPDTFVHIRRSSSLVEKPSVVITYHKNPSQLSVPDDLLEHLSSHANDNKSLDTDELPDETHKDLSTGKLDDDDKSGIKRPRSRCESAPSTPILSPPPLGRSNSHAIIIGNNQSSSQEYSIPYNSQLSTTSLPTNDYSTSDPTGLAVNIASSSATEVKDSETGGKEKKGWSLFMRKTRRDLHRRNKSSESLL